VLQDQTQKQKIGTDEWVASYDQRMAQVPGLRGDVLRLSQRLPFWAWIVLLTIGAALVPILTDNTYVIHVAGTIALMATLAIGLNVVVGYAGLLDLGYISFYGIGGYAYAYMSSAFSGLHWPTWLSLIVIVVVAALFGLLLGSPSLRLVGDYLAIVTLGFGQIFTQLMTSLTRVNLPGRADPVNLTGGPNGIVALDPVNFLGFKANGETQYYYILLLLLVGVLLFVYRVNHSRIGRAWRALREDQLAAEAMGMPTRRLKLMAFAMGAAIAGLSGGLFAAWQGSVFPNNFETSSLITLYAIVVLGGLGSLPGIMLGAVIMIAVPEILRDPSLAGLAFYIGIIIVLVAVVRPRWHAVIALAGLAFFASALKILAGPDLVSAMPPTDAAVTTAIRGWLIIPKNYVHFGNLAFVALTGMLMVITRLKLPSGRVILLIPTLYLLMFVWETRLSQEPSVTRLIFVGVLLVLLMIYRPNGLMGKKRVEVV
jgi:branched-chain amino acid transport system permease protein